MTHLRRGEQAAEFDQAECGGVNMNGEVKMSVQEAKAWAGLIGRWRKRVHLDMGLE